MQKTLGCMWALLAVGCTVEELSLGAGSLDGGSRGGGSLGAVACDPKALPCGLPCKADEGSGCGDEFVLAECWGGVWRCGATDATVPEGDAAAEGPVDASACVPEGLPIDAGAADRGLLCPSEPSRLCATPCTPEASALGMTCYWYEPQNTVRIVTCVRGTWECPTDADAAADVVDAGAAVPTDAGA